MNIGQLTRQNRELTARPEKAGTKQQLLVSETDLAMSELAATLAMMPTDLSQSMQVPSVTVLPSAQKVTSCPISQATRGYMPRYNNGLQLMFQHTIEAILTPNAFQAFNLTI